jgi:hypothetical protein
VSASGFVPGAGWRSGPGLRVGSALRRSAPSSPPRRTVRPRPCPARGVAGDGEASRHHDPRDSRTPEAVGVTAATAGGVAVTWVIVDEASTSPAGIPQAGALPSPAARGVDRSTSMPVGPGLRPGVLGRRGTGQEPQTPSVPTLRSNAGLHSAVLPACRAIPTTRSAAEQQRRAALTDTAQLATMPEHLPG